MDSYPTQQVSLKVIYTHEKSSSSSCLARVDNVQAPVCEHEGREIGSVDLMTCVGAICKSSPELLSRESTDYAVYSLDIAEQHSPLVGHGKLSALQTRESPADVKVLGVVSTKSVPFKPVAKILEVELRLVAIPGTSCYHYDRRGEYDIASDPIRPQPSSLHYDQTRKRTNSIGEFAHPGTKSVSRQQQKGRVTRSSYLASSPMAAGNLSTDEDNNDDTNATPFSDTDPLQDYINAPPTSDSDSPPLQGIEPKKEPQEKKETCGVQDIVPTCKVCSVRETSVWRRVMMYDDVNNPEIQTLCNPCGLYYAKHKSHRPAALWRKPVKNRKRKGKKDSSSPSNGPTPPVVSATSPATRPDVDHADTVRVAASSPPPRTRPMDFSALGIASSPPQPSPMSHISDHHLTRTQKDRRSLQKNRESKLANKSSSATASRTSSHEEADIDDDELFGPMPNSPTPSPGGTTRRKSTPTKLHLPPSDHNPQPATRAHSHPVKRSDSHDEKRKELAERTATLPAHNIPQTPTRGTKCKAFGKENLPPQNHTEEEVFDHQNPNYREIEALFATPKRSPARHLSENTLNCTPPSSYMARLLSAHKQMHGRELDQNLKDLLASPSPSKKYLGDAIYGSPSSARKRELDRDLRDILGSPSPSKRRMLDQSLMELMSCGNSDSLESEHFYLFTDEK